MSDPLIGPDTESAASDSGDLHRLSPLTPLARSGVIFAGVAFGISREGLFGGSVTWYAGIAALVIVVGLVYGAVSWWRTTYRITDTELRVDSGVLVRNSRRVRLDRIIEIGVNQPLVARLFGLAELKLETASQERDVSLAFLPIEEAHEVRRILLSHRIPAPGTTARVDTDGPAAPAATVEPQFLMAIPVRWQLIGLALSPEAFITLAALILAGVLLAHGVPLGAFGVGFLSLVGAAFSLVRKVVDWWGWTLSTLPAGLQVKHGMTNVTTRSFNVQRLQGVKVSEPMLFRLVGMARLEMSVVGGALKDSNEGSAGVAIPIAPRDLVWRLASDLVGRDPATVPLEAPPKRARWLAPIGAPFELFGMDDRLVVRRSGILARRWDLVALARVQSFHLLQGPIQRFFGLAKLRGDCPAGLVNITGEHRDEKRARELLAEAARLARVARMPAGRVPTVTEATDRPGDVREVGN